METYEAIAGLIIVLICIVGLLWLTSIALGIIAEYFGIPFWVLTSILFIFVVWIKGTSFARSSYKRDKK